MASGLQLAVMAENPALESQLAFELQAVARIWGDVRVAQGVDSSGAAQIVFIDASLAGRLDSILARLDRRGKAVFLISKESAVIPEPFRDGKVDDVLVHPFRSLEVLSKLQRYRQILMWDEVVKLNASFSQVIEQLRADLQIVERLQKARLPEKFPPVKGFKIAHRYLAGMRSGGDYLDLAEARDGSVLSFVLSDSSSYGLSSAVLTVLMRVAAKVSAAQMRGASEVVRQIQDELMSVLGAKDRLSLFFGVLGRRDYRLRFLNLGTSRAFYREPGKPFRELPSQGEAISSALSPEWQAEGELTYAPGGRLVLLSDGFIETCGGSDPARTLLERFRDGDAGDLLNELVFRVKSGFEEPDDLPAQDCTAAVFDLDPKTMRLAN